MPGEVVDALTSPGTKRPDPIEFLRTLFQEGLKWKDLTEEMMSRNAEALKVAAHLLKKDCPMFRDRSNGKPQPSPITKVGDEEFRKRVRMATEAKDTEPGVLLGHGAVSFEEGARNGKDEGAPEAERLVKLPLGAYDAMEPLRQLTRGHYEWVARKHGLELPDGADDVGGEWPVEQTIADDVTKNGRAVQLVEDGARTAKVGGAVERNRGEKVEREGASGRMLARGTVELVVKKQQPGGGKRQKNDAWEGGAARGGAVGAAMGFHVEEKGLEKEIADKTRAQCAAFGNGEQALANRLSREIIELQARLEKQQDKEWARVDKRIGAEDIRTAGRRMNFGAGRGRSLNSPAAEPLKAKFRNLSSLPEVPIGSRLANIDRSGPSFTDVRGDEQGLEADQRKGLALQVEIAQMVVGQDMEVTRGNTRDAVEKESPAFPCHSIKMPNEPGRDQRPKQDGQNRSESEKGIDKNFSLTGESPVDVMDSLSLLAEAASKAALPVSRRIADKPSVFALGCRTDVSMGGGERGTQLDGAAALTKDRRAGEKSAPRRERGSNVGGAGEVDWAVFN